MHNVAADDLAIDDLGPCFVAGSRRFAVHPSLILQLVERTEDGSPRVTGSLREVADRRLALAVLDGEPSCIREDCFRASVHRTGAAAGAFTWDRLPRRACLSGDQFSRLLLAKRCLRGHAIACFVMDCGTRCWLRRRRG